MKENSFKNLLRETKLPKRNRSKENLMRTRNMKAACIEIQNNNLINWNKRRKKEIEVREKTDKIETENLERMKRKNLSMYKKKKTLKHLKEKGLVERKGETRELILEKTALWRKYRDETIATEGDTTISDGIEGNEKTFVEIGKRVEVKLKKTVFKNKFSDP